MNLMPTQEEACKKLKGILVGQQTADARDDPKPLCDMQEFIDDAPKDSDKEDNDD
jgi:hypothetical protein